MSLSFCILSAAYIFGIFFYADSPLVSQFGVFNPFSLLHIPLYGILTIFLVRALCPRQETNSKRRYTFAALIAMGVAILDEFYQSFIPSREGSITDVLLDVLGVSLAMFLFLRGSFSHWTGIFQNFKKMGLSFLLKEKETLKLKGEDYEKD